MCNIVFLFGSIDERVEATFPEEIWNQGVPSEHGETGWSEASHTSTAAAAPRLARAGPGQGASASYTRK